MTGPTTGPNRAALFAALHTTFLALHPACDQIVQTSRQATVKGQPGWAGRRACAAHVATYTTTQLLGAVTVLRMLGYRTPPAALLAGATLNAATHYLIDRRTPLRWLASKVYRKRQYLDWGTVARPQPDGTTLTDTGGGPGTALFELDQATHHGIALLASLLTTILATRSETTTC